MDYDILITKEGLSILKHDGPPQTHTPEEWYALSVEAAKPVKQEPQEPRLDELISAWSIVRGVKDELGAMPIEYRADQFRELTLLSVARCHAGDKGTRSEDAVHSVVLSYLTARTPHDVTRLIAVLVYRDHIRNRPGNTIKNTYMTSLEACLWDSIYTMRSKGD